MHKGNCRTQEWRIKSAQGALPGPGGTIRSGQVDLHGRERTSNQRTGGLAGSKIIDLLDSSSLHWTKGGFDATRTGQRDLQDPSEPTRGGHGNFQAQMRWAKEYVGSKGTHKK